MSVLIRVLIPVLLLVGGYMGMKVLEKAPEENLNGQKTSSVKADLSPSKPNKPNKTGGSHGSSDQVKKSKEAVETKAMVLKKEDYPVEIESEGVVMANHMTTLTARVSGRVKRVSPLFETGGFFNEGDVLVEVETEDFQSALVSAEARLAQAEASVVQEEARAKQALLNWKDIGYEDEPSDLVLRKPQMKEAQARLKSAQADIDKAMRDLERTKIRAPFNGCVAERTVGVGQSIGQSTKLGEIFSTNYVEVRFPVSASELAYVRLPGADQATPTKVRIEDALGLSGLGEVNQWVGELVRADAMIDEESRELFLTARVNDPYQRSQQEKGRPALRVGQPVRIKMEGKVLEQVFVIPRDAMQTAQMCIVIDPSEMIAQRVEINSVWETADSLIVRYGLKEDWFLALSRLPKVSDKTPMIIEEESGSATDGSALGRKVEEGETEKSSG